MILKVFFKKITRKPIQKIIKIFTLILSLKVNNLKPAYENINAIMDIK